MILDGAFPPHGGPIMHRRPYVMDGGLPRPIGEVICEMAVELDERKPLVDWIADRLPTEAE